MGLNGFLEGDKIYVYYQIFESNENYNFFGFEQNMKKLEPVKL